MGSEPRDAAQQPLPNLVGLAEVAKMLNVSKRTASAYTRRQDFPAPVQRLAATPIWRHEEVRAWADSTLPLPTGRPATRD